LAKITLFLYSIYAYLEQGVVQHVELDEQIFLH
jgi:hypothetical protein